MIYFSFLSSYFILFQISFLKKGKDQNIAIPLVIDGEIKEDGLLQTGFSKKRLLDRIKRQNVKLENVFLLTSDESENINIYIKERKKK